MSGTKLGKLRFFLGDLFLSETRKKKVQPGKKIQKVHLFFNYVSQAQDADGVSTN